MEQTPHAFYWEAPEHLHMEKTPDWYWILGILAIAGSVASILMHNILFGMVILLGAVTMMLVSHKKPRTIPYEISTRGIRIDNQLFPYTTLASFSLDEEHPHGAHLLVKSKKMLVPLLIIPVPEEYVVMLDQLLATKLPEEHLEEPIAHRLLELVGF
jgi:hypothetical protein